MVLNRRNVRQYSFGEASSGDHWEDIQDYDALLLIDAAGNQDTYNVLNGQGVWGINRKPKGIYKSINGVWTYTGIDDVQSMILNYTDDKLDKSDNLGSLTSTTQARTNLNVYSKGETDALVGGLSWEYYVANFSHTPTLIVDEAARKVFMYTLSGVVRYRVIPIPYDPTGDIFYEEVGLTNEIIRRG